MNPIGCLSKLPVVQWSGCFLLCLGIAACAPAPDLPPQQPNTGDRPGDPVVGVDCVDETKEWGPPEEGQLLFEVPTMLVPPGQEVVFCYYDTYRGGDAGIVGYRPEDVRGFMHHAVMKRSSASEHPDGALIDCTSVENQFPPPPTLVETVGDPEEGNWLDLPPGLAFPLPTGQRWFAEAHYVNTSADAVCVNTAFYIDLIDDSEVEAYVGTVNFDAGGFSIPPQSNHEEVFDCSWPLEDVYLLSLGGHMHEFGAAINIAQAEDAAGAETVLYSVDDWEPEFRYLPPLLNFEPGEVPIATGDVLRTTCAWENDTGGELSYPDEMCTVFGVAYPLPESIHCDAGNWFDQSGRLSGG